MTYLMQKKSNRGFKERYSLEPKKEFQKGTEGIVRSVHITGLAKKRIAVQKKFFSDNKQWVIIEKMMWRKLKSAKLPVPEFFVPVLRAGSRERLSVLMENLEEKYGKLIPVNSPKGLGLPDFLSRLSIKRDKKLIIELASDLAVMNSLGIRSGVVDFWHFYKKKNGSYGRVIIDYGRLREDLPKNAYNSNSKVLAEFFGKEEFELFKKSYERKFASRAGRQNEGVLK